MMILPGNLQAQLSQGYSFVEMITHEDMTIGGLKIGKQRTIDYINQVQLLI